MASGGAMAMKSGDVELSKVELTWVESIITDATRSILIYLNDLILRDIDPHITNWFEHIKDSIYIRIMVGAGLLDHH